MESKKVLNKLWLAALMAGFLVGCSGGDGVFDENGEGGEGGGSSEESAASNATFYPLNFYHQGEEYGYKEEVISSSRNFYSISCISIYSVLKRE